MVEFYQGFRGLSMGEKIFYLVEYCEVAFGPL